MRGSIGFLPFERCLRGTVGIILPAFWSVVGGMCAPMFLAERAMFLSVAFLGNPVIEGDHFPLGRLSRLGGGLSSISNLVGGICLFNALKDF